jgi:hypothetical protein
MKFPSKLETSRRGEIELWIFILASYRCVTYEPTNEHTSYVPKEMIRANYRKQITRGRVSKQTESEALPLLTFYPF